MKIKLDYNISEPLKIGNLAIFGISSPTNGKEQYLCLPEALEKKLVEIREVSEEGSVNDLSLKNHSSKTLLCVEGEMLNGCKQQRVLNTSVLVPPFTKITIPVSCVEAGRWSWKSNRFSSTEEMYFAKGRANMRNSVFYHSRNYGSKYSNQNKVWEDVDEKLEKMDAYSQTSSVNQAYFSKKERINKIVKLFQIEKNDIGIIYGIGNKIIGGDFFYNNHVFNVYFPKIIRSICLDAFEKKAMRSNLSKKDAQMLLNLVHLADFEKHKAVSTGEEFRANDQLLIATGLFHKKVSCHFSAFIKNELPQSEWMVA